MRLKVAGVEFVTVAVKPPNVPPGEAVSYIGGLLLQVVETKLVITGAVLLIGSGFVIKPTTPLAAA